LNRRKKISKEKYLEPDEYVKGVQISISLSKNMPIDPYFVKGEYFYKMRVVLGYLEPILALGMLISFFLPWISIDSIHMSAYELLRVDNYDEIFDQLRLEALLYGFYICFLLSVLLIVLPLYKIFNETSLLNRKKIAFNSKLLKPWLAFGLLGAFFLPWFNFDFFYLSGYALLLNEAYTESYWFIILIPIFSIILLVNYRFNMKLKVMSFLTGITPYGVLIMGAIASDESSLRMLNIGAYISLLLGAGLIFLSLRFHVKNIFNKNRNKQ